MKLRETPTTVEIAESNRSIITDARSVLMQLMEAIQQLNYDEYTLRIPLLSNSSIGEHTRHIIELFQQLLVDYELGIIEYDKRKRELLIQESIDFACECIAHIVEQLDKANKNLELISVHSSESMRISTNYFRELVYNIEHCIHHQAIIKIGLMQLGKTELIEEFGVAKATILYRQSLQSK